MTKREREEKEYAQGIYVERRNERNACVDALTDEQHEALAALCADRHYMHVNALGDIWSEDPNRSTTYGLVGGVMSDSRINDYLASAGLPTVKLADYDDCLNVASYSDYLYDDRDDYDDDEFERLLVEVEESEKEKIMRICEKNDRAIIEYLAKIDAEHGTEYAPTGMSRKLI